MEEWIPRLVFSLIQRSTLGEDQGIHSSTFPLFHFLSNHGSCDREKIRWAHCGEGMIWGPNDYLLPDCSHGKGNGKWIMEEEIVSNRWKE